MAGMFILKSFIVVKLPEHMVWLKHSKMSF